jgi:uncharacterized protein YcsI (UPF0317 family)
VRAAARTGAYTGQTSGLAGSHLQANVVILPSEFAFEFLLFCQRNPKPCPVIEVLEPGVVEPLRSAPGADIRTDVPRYRVFRDGVLVDEPTDLRAHWREDLVTFLLGCSFTFERALLRVGIPLPHVGSDRTVAMYRTSLRCAPAGRLRGPLVVSMRWVAPGLVARAVEVTSRYEAVHGAPVHVGGPAALGIADLGRPDYGDAWEQPDGALPVFWACGVTPQAAAVESRPPLMITHAPGHMLVTDLLDLDVARP